MSKKVIIILILFTLIFISTNQTFAINVFAPIERDIQNNSTVFYNYDIIKDPHTSFEIIEKTILTGGFILIESDTDLFKINKNEPYKNIIKVNRKKIWQTTSIKRQQNKNIYKVRGVTPGIVTLDFINKKTGQIEKKYKITVKKDNSKEKMKNTDVFDVPVEVIKVQKSLLSVNIINSKFRYNNSDKLLLKIKIDNNKQNKTNIPDNNHFNIYFTKKQSKYLPKGGLFILPMNEKRISSEGINVFYSYVPLDNLSKGIYNLHIELILGGKKHKQTIENIEVKK